MSLTDPIVIDRLSFIVCFGGPALVVVLIPRPSVAIPLGALVMWGTLVLSAFLPHARQHEDEALIQHVILMFGWLVALVYAAILFGVRWVVLRTAKLVHVHRKN
jgi:hypothetical protein